MALHAAIEQNDTTALAKLLDKGASNDGGVDQQDSNGWTPLLTACGHGHSSCVQLLLIAHAALDRPTNEGRTPLHAACNQGHVEIMQLLLTSRAAADRPDSWGSTPLHIACGQGHSHLVLLLLGAHAAVDRPTSKGRTPLYAASHQGHSNCVRLLHAARATVDRPEDSHGWTPLFAACCQGHGDCAQLLLAAHAAIDRSTTSNGTTPLCTASHQGHSNCVQQLLAAHAAVDNPNRDGSTPLYAACDQGHGDCVQLLLAAHAAVDQPTNAGATPMHAACQVGSLPIVKLLVQAGAKPELVFTDGRMPPMLKELLRPWRDTLLSQSVRADSRAQRDTQKKKNRKGTTKAIADQSSQESVLKKILDSNEAQMGASMEARRVASAEEAVAVEQQCIEFEAMRVAYNSKEFRDALKAERERLEAEAEAKAQAEAQAEAEAESEAGGGTLPTPESVSDLIVMGMWPRRASHASVTSCCRDAASHSATLTSAGLCEKLSSSGFCTVAISDVRSSSCSVAPSGELVSPMSRMSVCMASALGMLSSADMIFAMSSTKSTCARQAAGRPGSERLTQWVWGAAGMGAGAGKAGEGGIGHRHGSPYAEAIVRKPAKAWRAPGISTGEREGQARCTARCRNSSALSSAESAVRAAAVRVHHPGA